MQHFNLQDFPLCKIIFVGLRTIQRICKNESKQNFLSMREKALLYLLAKPCISSLNLFSTLFITQAIHGFFLLTHFADQRCSCSCLSFISITFIWGNKTCLFKTFKIRLRELLTWPQTFINNERKVVCKRMG